MTARADLDLGRAVEVLCDSSLADVVDLVCLRDQIGPREAIVVRNAAGGVRLWADADGVVNRELLGGRDPLLGEDSLAFTPLASELLDPSPPNERNHYPLAWERLSSLFAAPAAPDIAVVHTGRHHWPEREGHLGEHGSLSVVQSRAPLIIAGAGVEVRGMLPRSSRVIDVGPTLSWMCDGADADFSSYDGSALRDLVAPTASFVVGLLWDGCNSNSLYARAAAGQLPNVARLLEMGCGLVGGAVAEFPSVTLVNHTSAITGVGPGRHGIVNNAYFDRAAGVQRLTNDARTWHRWSEWIAPGVSTVFQRVSGATACVNEPADAGADYSTFSLVRSSGPSEGASGMNSWLPDPTVDDLAAQEWVRTNKHYAWSSSVDAVGLQQMLELFGPESSPPRLTWWNTLLTDTGHHEGGPHSDIAHDSMADADRRLGAFLDHLDSAGLLSRTAFLLTADHGSEGADPNCRGDWDEALRSESIPFRDEAYGFIYLGHS